MSLTLHFHPLSSFSHKVLIGLYELDVPFEKHIVDLGNETARAAFLALSPLGKMPALRDDVKDHTIPESSIILEYLDQRFGHGQATTTRLIPADKDRALECRLQDRFFDQYIHVPMQKLVNDRLRPAEKRDALGVEQARGQIEAAYAIADRGLRNRTWGMVMGDDFTLADCAAAPALFYAAKLVPLDAHRHLAAYFARLSERPSVARVVNEAKPYMAMFPG